LIFHNSFFSVNKSSDENVFDGKITAIPKIPPNFSASEMGQFTHWHKIQHNYTKMSCLDLQIETGHIADFQPHTNFWAS